MNLVEKINFYKKCKIIDAGAVYDMYSEFITKYCPEDKKQYFVYSDMPKTNHMFYLIKKEKHQNNEDMICIIEDIKTKQIYLIKEEGIQLL